MERKTGFPETKGAIVHRLGNRQVTRCVNWSAYEWKSFADKLAYGLKPEGAMLIAFISGVSVSSLPMCCAITSRWSSIY